MAAWHKEAFKSMDEGWKSYLEGLDKALNDLEKDVEDAKSVADKCTSEWCEATEHVIDELANAVFSIHEPTFTDDATTTKIKEMKRRIHELYAQYKAASA